MLRDKWIHQGKENVKLSNLQTPLPTLFGGFKEAMSKSGEWKSGHWVQANPLQGKREASLRRKESSMWASSSWGREGGRGDKGGTGSRGPLSGRGRGSTGEISPHIHFHISLIAKGEKGASSKAKLCLHFQDISPTCRHKNSLDSFPSPSFETCLFLHSTSGGEHNTETIIRAGLGKNSKAFDRESRGNPKLTPPWKFRVVKHLLKKKVPWKFGEDYQRASFPDGVTEAH